MGYGIFDTHAYTKYGNDTTIIIPRRLCTNRIYETYLNSDFGRHSRLPYHTGHIEKLYKLYRKAQEVDIGVGHTQPDHICVGHGNNR